MLTLLTLIPGCTYDNEGMFIPRLRYPIVQESLLLQSRFEASDRLSLGSTEIPRGNGKHKPRLGRRLPLGEPLWNGSPAMPKGR